MNRYLDRIKVRPDEVNADLGTLSRLQHRHLTSIPFENLDIHWGQRIVLDTNAFYDKIVTGGRGGFCYELNGLFNKLLQQTGFRTRLVSAQVFREDGSLGSAFDHAAIIVTLDEIEYLIDVGFGDFTAGPLRVEPGEPQDIRGETFIVEANDANSFRVSRRDGDEWAGQYTFNEAARDLAEFREMCDFQQDSPLSHFTQKKVCSILTENGRKTLTDNKFIVTANGKRTENSVESENEFYRILMDEFRIGRPTPVI